MDVDVDVEDESGSNARVNSGKANGGNERKIITTSEQPVVLPKGKKGKNRNRSSGKVRDLLKMNS